MEYFREELFPCVSLTAVQTDKFKTGCMTAYLLTQLHRETAAENAVLPYVLRRGTKSLPDMRRISERLDALYGAEIEPSVRKLGEIQAVGFYAGFSEDAFLPGETDVLGEVISLLSELWLSPATRGGLFLPAYVDSEREQLVERIERVKNDKRSWAFRRLRENMCAYEDYATGAYGTADEAGSIHYVKLTKHYKELLAVSPMEIFYCGSLGADAVAEKLSDAFSGMPRGEIDYDIGTDIRMNAVEESVREFTDELSVTQGKLVMGYRLGDCMEDPDIAALYVFNAVFGGCVTSKLFMNVREKLSLCYYASSLVDLHKGLMIVSSGVDFDKFGAAKDEICAQLEAIKRGEVTDDELLAAKKSVASDLRATLDSQYNLEGFYLANTIDGLDFDPEELAEAVECVELQTVVDIANSVVGDAVYYLRGNGEEDSDEA